MKNKDWWRNVGIIIAVLILIPPFAGCVEKGTETGENMAPSVTIDANVTSGDAPLSVNFTANATDPDGYVANYTWNFGDGNTSYQQNPVHVFTEPNTYNVTLTVKDNNGSAAICSMWITAIEVGPENELPTVTITHPLNGTTISGTITIQGTASDSDGEVQTVQVKIDDNAWKTASGTTSWSYGWDTTKVSNGAHSVYARSHDGRNYSSIYSVGITVDNPLLNQRPVADASNTHPIQANTGQQITFDGSASYDPDGIIVLYEWDWTDDGTYDWSGSSATTTHSYSSNGTYTAKLRVTDNDGASDTCTKQITISNVAPVAVNDTAVTNEDTAVVINISINDYDSDGSIDLSSIVITSAVSHGSIDVNTNGTVTYTPDSNYYGYDEFDYTIKDNDGVTSNIATVTITINGVNDLPVANFSYSPPAPTTQITVHFADLSSDVDGSIVNWTWNFGDGNTSYLQDPTHQYADNGMYNVTLTVTDDDGATEYDVQQITVLSASGGNFSIACWNLECFGKSKATNTTLLNYYANKLDDYDISIVQEIRNKTGEAIQLLADKLPGYQYIVSERAGSSARYKEQYAIFYDSRATLVSYHDYTPEKQNEFERPPLEATFTVSNWTFTLYTIHTKPSNVENELINLENLTGEPSTDTLIIGDLNADGSYYIEDNRSQFTNWDWVITNDMDTTVSPNNDYTYDRIIINNAAEDNFIRAGVMSDVNIGQSDHYLVYAVFNTNTSAVINVPPVAGFTYHTDNITAYFTDISSDPDGDVLTYDWDFGDGNTSEEQNPTHTYSTEGTYNVTLIVSDGKASDSTSKYVTVTQQPSTGHIVINEIEQNPYGDDAGNEWVELFNPTDSAIDVSGWKLQTTHGNIETHYIPEETTINSGGYLVITFNKQFLDNNGDSVILFDRNSNEIDRTPVVGDSHDDSRSWQRTPNGYDSDSPSDWQFKYATEGYSNS